MKRLSALFPFLLACLWAGAATVDVTTASEFITAARNNADIRLKADIDIRGIGMLDITFRGTIDGGDKNASGDAVIHSLKGGTGSGRVSEPIFKAVDGASFSNLVICNFRIEWDDDYVGAVAMTAENSSFSQVVLSDISVFNDDDYAGAIAGRAENCDFTAVRGMGNDITVDGNRAGGFVGVSSNCKYTDCSNSAYSTVYSDGSWGNAYAGGFVGESQRDQFVECVNFASVGALDDRIGGIAGYGEFSIFTGCSNSGYIVHCEEDDFINATMAIKVKLDDILKNLEDEYDLQDTGVTLSMITLFGSIGAMSVMALTDMGLVIAGIACAPLVPAALIVIAAGIVATVVELIIFNCEGHDELGGICGTCVAGRFNTCANYGTCLCRDAQVGGIVGFLDHASDYSVRPTITDCLNAGYVQGYESVGGIAGMCVSGTNTGAVVSNCLNTGNLKADGGTANPICEGGNQSHNYYRSNIHKDGDNTAVTEEELESGQVAWALNGGQSSENSLWHQTVGKDAYPTLDTDHAVVTDDILLGRSISTLDDLKALCTDVNSGKQSSYVVFIDADIDCSGYTWQPIGTSSHPFQGLCFGRGHSISNINVQSDGAGVGFFGVVGINTEVHDLNIASGSIGGVNGVGAIIGYAEYSGNLEGGINISGCSNAASVSATYDCGGLIGAIYTDKNMKLTLDNCCNSGSVTASRQAAALCGYAKMGALVTSCWNTGAVTGYESGKGFVRWYSGDGEGGIPEIHNCYNISSLSGLLQDGVESFTQADVTDGTLCFNLNGGSNESSVGLPWEQDLSVPGSYPRCKSYVNGSVVKNSRAVFASRQVSGRYGTVVLPYPVKSNDYIRYYVLENAIGGDETQINFTSVSTLPAGTPALFCVSEPGQVDFLSSDMELNYSSYAPYQVNGWYMKGNMDSSLADMVFTDSGDLSRLYYISADNLRNASKKLTIAPFRAYIEGPAPANGAPARTVSITFDDETTTGLKLVPVSTDGRSVTYGIFNLAGQRLDAMQRGVNIIDGKKVLGEK